MDLRKNRPKTQYHNVQLVREKKKELSYVILMGIPIS